MGFSKACCRRESLSCLSRSGAGHGAKEPNAVSEGAVAIFEAVTCMLTVGERK